MTFFASSSNTSMKTRPMVLRFCSGSVTPAQRGEEPLPRVDRDEVQLEVLAERGHDLLGLPLAQEAVVDEDAREPIAEGAVAEDRRDRRVDAARQTADDVLVGCRPCARTPAMASSVNAPAVQVGESPATSKRNAARMSDPRGVCTTSGWNCTP